MKRIIITCFLLFVSFLLFSQSKNVSSRPPWIMGEAPSWSVGELPRIDLRGNVLHVVFTQDANPETAQKKGETEIISYLLSRAGYTLDSHDTLKLDHQSQSISDGKRTKTKSSVTERYASEVIVNGKAFGRYCLLDKYVQYKGGRYYFAGLYLVADKDMSLASVPPITYGMDRGAWRSLVVPGWGQFYQGRSGAGVAFLGVEAVLLGTTVFFQNKVNINKQRIDEATSIDVKKAYKQRYDSMSMYRNIAAGASLAWYAYNAVDAFTSKKGKLYYTVAYGNGFMTFSPAPVLIPDTGDMGVGLAFNYRF